ncbi:GAF domain-containing protein [Streptomyces sp. NPDC017638]|uniref:GAF domain-containing protein n=1 Tax=Streptomyces sp. NPDC017638 TaxID=3365004 RepID=UPI0037A25019
MSGLRVGWGTATMGTLGVVTYVAPIVLGLGLKLPIWIAMTIMGVGVLATVATVIMSRQEAVAARRDLVTAEQAAKAAAERARGAMEDVLTVLVHHIGEIVSANSKSARSPLQQQMKLAIVSLTAQLIGPENARACVLEIAPASPGSPGVREMKCLAGLWMGRAEAPRTVFREDQARGASLLKLMDDRKSTFVENVDALAPELRPETDSYKTYITATITAAGKDAFGVLCVDAPNPGDLRKEDIRLVEVLARLLGAALAVRR